MAWTDRSRWEMIGLLDDPGQEFLRSSHSAVWDALRNDEYTADAVDPSDVHEFDVALQWLLRSQGVPA